MQRLEEITKMADQLPPADQLKLVEHLSQILQRQSLSNKQPVDLYGTWKNRFSHEIDIESELREIRAEWKNELDFDL